MSCRVEQENDYRVKRFKIFIFFLVVPFLFFFFTFFNKDILLDTYINSFHTCWKFTATVTTKPTEQKKNSLETRCHSMRHHIGYVHTWHAVATGWTVRGSNPCGGYIFLTCPDWPWGPISLPYNRYRIFPGVYNRPGLGVDHPLPSSADVKERVELYLYSPSGPSWPVLWRTLPLPLPLNNICTSTVGHFGKDENHSVLTGNGTTIPRFPIRSLVSVLSWHNIIARLTVIHFTWADLINLSLRKTYAYWHTVMTLRAHYSNY